MRLAFSFFSFAPHVNGVVTVYRRALDHLAKVGHDILMFVPPGSAANDPAGVVVECPGFELPTAPGYHVPFAPSDLEGRIAAFGPDLVHVVDPWPLNPLGNVMLKTARRLGIPSVAAYHTRHARYAQDHGVGLPLELLEGLEVALHARANLVITASARSMRDLRARGIESLRLWRGGVDTEVFHPSMASAELRARLLGDVPNGKLLVAVGRLAPEKNLAFLCELVRERSDLVLAIAGDGAERARLERLLPPGRGHLVGCLGHAELATLYASADVHVVSSMTEVQGLTVVESLASGTPVVAAHAGGLSEAIVEGLNGETVPVGDRGAFLDAIGRWVQPTAATRAACRETALGWDWGPLLEELEEHYAEAMRSRAWGDEEGAASLGCGLIRALTSFTLWTSEHVPMWLHRAVWHKVLGAARH